MIDKETINKKAEQYAEENNDCYTNDFYGFINGYNQALEDSHATEMLEMLEAKIYYLDNGSLLFYEKYNYNASELSTKTRELIKKVENTKIPAKK